MAEFINLRKALNSEAISYGYEGPQIAAFIKEQLEAYGEAKKLDAEREAKKLDAEREAKKLDAEREAKKLDAEREAEARKLDAEREARKLDAEREAEARRLDAEREARILEDKQRERELEFRKLDAQLRLAELASNRQTDTQNNRTDNPLSPNPSLTSNPFNPSNCAIWTDVYDPAIEQIDTYLSRFQDKMIFCQTPREAWGRNLVNTLRGPNYEIYAKLPAEERDSYDALKNALLTKYELNAQNYQKRFRTARLGETETYSQMRDRLKVYLLKWVELSNCEQTFDCLVDLMLSEQLRSLMPAKLKTFLAEMAADGLTHTIELADRYVLAHQEESSTSTPHQHINYKQNPRKDGMHNSRNNFYPTPTPRAYRGTNNHTPGVSHRPAPFSNERNRAGTTTSPPTTAGSILRQDNFAQQ